MRLGWLTLAFALIASPVRAACPLELAVYGDRNAVASLEFRPTGENAVVTNTFRLVVGSLVLDGIVMWSDGVGRPNGIVSYRCPQGDVTGPEYEACTLWQGVIYASDKDGTIALLPAEGANAPQRLILSDLGPALHMSPHFRSSDIAVPWDVFMLSGCQE